MGEFEPFGTSDTVAREKERDKSVMKMHPQHYNHK